MATAAVLPPHDVPTTLNYYIPADGNAEAPYQYVYDPPAGKPKDNIGLEKHEVVVRDARDKQEEYGLSLDTSGFQFVNHVSQEKEFKDDKVIETVYYKEVEELLKKEAGAKRVFIFDHTIRLNPEDVRDKDRLLRGPVVSPGIICTTCTHPYHPCRNASTLTRRMMLPLPECIVTLARTQNAF